MAGYKRSQAIILGVAGDMHYEPARKKINVISNRLEAHGKALAGSDHRGALVFRRNDFCFNLQ